ncbi:MAG: hypothetical protein JWQ02_785 [Capsulimonas sp.]|nr:hypothetical protein [Capsulimonas sp.]
MTQTIKPLPPELTDFIFELGPRTLVLVEGDDDIMVFEKLYLERLGDIAFFATDGDHQLEFLIQELQTVRPDVLAYGIRDRDFRSDAEVEAALANRDARLFVLRRYCIENYLLDPKIVWYVLNVYLYQKMPWKDAAEAEAYLLQLCVRLQHLMAANCALREIPAPGFKEAHDPLGRDETIAKIALILPCTVEEAEALIANKESQIVGMLQTLEQAYTRINGKHILWQLRMYAISLQKGLGYDHLFRLLLDEVKRQDAIHTDLREIVEQKILSGS